MTRTIGLLALITAMLIGGSSTYAQDDPNEVISYDIAWEIMNEAEAIVQEFEDSTNITGIVAQDPFDIPDYVLNALLETDIRIQAMAPVHPCNADMYEHVRFMSTEAVWLATEAIAIITGDDSDAAQDAIDRVAATAGLSNDVATTWDAETAATKLTLCMVDAVQ